MKIIFFGTSELAVSALAGLMLTRHKVLAAVTAPDTRKGRGLALTFSPVKSFAQKHNVAVVQPEDLRSHSFLNQLEKEEADLFAVCAFGKIMPKKLLQIPQKFAINLHTSLLPKYRGAAPINWAIIAGEKETGVTVFKMDEHMDEGEIILQKKAAISSADTAISLSQRLTQIGAQALVEAVDLIEQDKVTFTPQEEAQASSAPKLKKEDGLIDWQSSAQEVYNRIRGLQPWPGAFTYLRGKLLKIWQAEIAQGEPGRQPAEIVEIDRRKGLLVQTGRGLLLLTFLQPAGKRKMSASEFVLGHTIEVGEKLGK